MVIPIFHALRSSGVILAVPFKARSAEVPSFSVASATIERAFQLSLRDANIPRIIVPGLERPG
jgi:hypothetical protein